MKTCSPYNQTCKFNFLDSIRMTDNGNRSSDPPAPAEQFKPLQSVFQRRLINGIGAASLIAIGANFGGLTSSLLGLSPETARSFKLDALYPVGGYFRYIDANEGFDFVYPESWLGDQTLQYRAAEKKEKALDLPPLGSGGERRRNVNEPVVAFGPPGSNGELNVSVIVSPVSMDFSIEAFGGAEEVGEAIVRKITGKRMNVQGTLIKASLREDSLKNVKYYELEFAVESPMFKRHNVAVCCVRKGKLFTLNAQAPESVWPQFKAQFYTMAHSFNLV